MFWDRDQFIKSRFFKMGHILAQNCMHCKIWWWCVHSSSGELGFLPWTKHCVLICIDSFWNLHPCDIKFYCFEPWIDKLLFNAFRISINICQQMPFLMLLRWEVAKLVAAWVPCAPPSWAVQAARITQLRSFAVSWSSKCDQWENTWVSSMSPLWIKN